MKQDLRSYARHLGRYSVMGALLLSCLLVAGSVGSNDAQASSTGMTAQSTVASSIAGVQVQNVGSGTTTTLSITYYNPDGSMAQPASGFANPQVLPNLGPGQSYTVFGNTMGVAAGFSGSAVVSADQPLVAITNISETDASNNNVGGEAYDGITNPTNPVDVPLLQWNNGASSLTNSSISIQNTDTNPADAAATVTVTLKPASTSYPSITTSQANYSLKPGGQVQIGLTSLSGLPAGQRWIGSATISSGTGGPNLAVEVSQQDGFNNELLSYAPAGAGSSFVYAPLIESNHSATYRYFTGFQVQNTSGNAEPVYLYLNSIPSACGNPGYVDTQTLAGGASYTWFPVPGTTSVSDFLGSATACTPSGTLIGAVNETAGNGAAITGQGATYSGFNDTVATSTVSMPLVENNHSGFFTGEQIQNVGTAATTAYIYQGGVPSTGCGTGTPANSVPLNPGQSTTWFAVPGQAVGPALSATACVPAGGKIVGIVHENRPGYAGDNSYIYEAFNQ